MKLSNFISGLDENMALRFFIAITLVIKLVNAQTIAETESITEIVTIEVDEPETTEYASTSEMTASPTVTKSITMTTASPELETDDLNGTEIENTTTLASSSTQTTTIEVTTEAQTTNQTTVTMTTTTMATTPVPSFPPPTEPSFENIATVVGMEADMTLAEEFSPELENPSSPQFQNLSRNVEAATTLSMRDVEEFHNVTVHGFRNGSIIVNLTIFFTDALKSDPGGDLSFCERIANRTNSIGNSTGFSFGRNCTAVIQDAKAAACASNSQGLCPRLHNCQLTASSGTSCVHPCYELVYMSDRCLSADGFACSVDISLASNIYEPVCSCLGDYIYISAEYCLHHDVIIIIATVCGGVLFIVFLVVTTFLLCRDTLTKVDRSIPLMTKYTYNDNTGSQVENLDYSSGQPLQDEPRAWAIQPYIPTDDVEERFQPWVIQPMEPPNDIPSDEVGIEDETKNESQVSENRDLAEGHDLERTKSDAKEGLYGPHLAFVRSKTSNEDRKKKDEGDERRAKSAYEGVIHEEQEFFPFRGQTNEALEDENGNIHNREETGIINRQSVANTRDWGGTDVTSYDEENNPTDNATSSLNQPESAIYANVGQNYML